MMSTYFKSFMNLFKLYSNNVPSKKVQGKLKVPLTYNPCIKTATKEVKELGWMKQPVVKHPQRFKVELGSSSDCKFVSFLTCSTELIADQDPTHVYSTHPINSPSQKRKPLSPIDEFIKAALLDINTSNDSYSMVKSSGKLESVSNMNKAVSKFQHEQSRLQRNKFTKSSGYKCQQKSAESFSEPLLASPPPENNLPNSNEVLFFLPFKAKVTAGSRRLQDGTSKTNETNKTTGTNNQHFHRAPVTYNKNAWFKSLA